ncbi:hypothetical protein M433DRAFT_151698 [Acidomyces richmondensis BFW]|nr:MAG: hypothetical protein FE78DRAFT_85948 [Acidomyces sp. 'richmondensis']KYG47899.1 hypothetical protein M433DRAFT_151698 [Acidomyces richmondensis BFW]
MSSEHILCLPRTDVEGGSVLVNVIQSGQKPLDLKIFASESTRVFVASVKESNIQSTQSNNYTGSLEEWKMILQYVLLKIRTDGDLPELLQGLDTVASVQSSAITISVRKNFSGIYQRLGSIQVPEDNRAEVNFYNWAATAASAAEDLRKQLEDLRASVTAQQQQVADLNRQLDELIQAKKVHENELLEKFAALINAKKLKIRDQQRLLARAKIEPSVAEEVKNSRIGIGREIGSSRRVKRKAVGYAQDTAEQRSADDDEGLGGEQTAPQSSDTESTADELDADDMFRHAAPVPANKSLIECEENSDGPLGEKRTGNVPMEVDTNDLPPPRRKLPFITNDIRKGVEYIKPHQLPTAVDEHGDESTDDEL